MNEVEILPPEKPWLWKIGQSGNPKGDTGAKREVLELARMNSMAALKRIVALMDDPKAGKAVQPRLRWLA